MKSIGELLVFHCVGLYGQWLGYCKGWPFLITFWFFVTALIWLKEAPRWSQLLETSVQGSCLIVLVLFALNFLNWG
jgi:hypothetical protein